MKSLPNKHITPWPWILDNAEYLDRISRKIAVGAGLDYEEFKQQLITRIAEKWEFNDPTKSKTGTWAMWQARGVKTQMVRDKRKRMNEDDIVNETGECFLTFPIDFEKQIDARRQIESICNIATDDEAKVLYSRITEMNEPARNKYLGFSRESARRRMLRLKNKLDEAGIKSAGR